MCKGTTKLRATEWEALDVLAKEAKRRKTSYGDLIANTTEQERADIIQDYCSEVRKKRKKANAP